ALGHDLGRNVNPLQKIRARFVEEDDRLGRLELGEEEPTLPTLAPPVTNQVERRPRRPRIASLTPLRESLADQVDELELLPLATRGMIGLRRRSLRIAVEVARPPARAQPLRRVPFLDLPVLGRLLERRVENRLL